MDVVKGSLFTIRNGINGHFSGKEPWQIVSVTASSVLLTVWLYDFIFRQDEDIAKRAKKTFFRYIRYIPAIRDKIDAEMKEIANSFEKDVEEKSKHLTYLTSMPEKGQSNEDILKIMKEYLKMGDYNWKEGFVSGAVYVCDQDLVDLVAEVYRSTAYTNPLHPDIFPGLCKMEAEIIKMAAALFHGDDEVCGCMTTGGTESILMACKAYRDYGREVKGIKRPEIVVPCTIHSAFDKASQYFGLRVRSIPIDPNTAQVNIQAMKRAINSNTIMLAGSAPNFPYGTMDDIEAISQLGVKYNIPVHVDACLGGFLTVFMEKAGYPVPSCDFRLPGVTSISADTHKYAFSPKGSSIVLYREKKYRHYQYTVTTDWPGGVYGSPTVSGSRAGGNIAVCWATLLSHGLNGYVEATRNIIHTTRYIEKGLRRLKGIYVFGTPVTSVIAVGSVEFDVFRLADSLNKSGWNLSPLQFPSGFHLCVTKIHTEPGVADRFLNDVKTCLEEILKHPQDKVEGKMALYGVAQGLPDRSLVGDFTRYFLDSMTYVPKQEGKNKALFNNVH